eukprot:TRINITY_DN10367_c0_g1_i1.p1 TRINITY_DN10367_c0_g1~~TRINITY_DN10367_c0_g1_i1.p1  ORF type:complete len:667 (-),score=104.83 TRINITY_DN10367_c0_g1_i1:290-2290(-)
MDLTSSQHSFQGSKQPHDFLALYGESNPSRSGHRSDEDKLAQLRTQDFLQPLERSGKATDHNIEASSGAETPVTEAVTASVEHILPGGIGSYSIGHISSYGQTDGKSDIPIVHVNAMEPKPEVSRAPFALWEERTTAVDSLRVADALASSGNEFFEKSGYWPTVRPRTDLSFHGKAPFNFSSVESGHQSLPSSSKNRPQTNQGFTEMMKSIKAVSEDDEEEDDDYAARNQEKRLPPKCDLPPKADNKVNESKANTPRSKHSATEQRRRSKINDRFQMLRELVPHSDQKRDKASFLLEVIEYIQLLQEKVRKYETTEQAWNQEGKKSMVWDMSKRSPGPEAPSESSRIVNGAILESKQNNENGASSKTMKISTTIHPDNAAASVEKVTNSHPPLPCNKLSPLIPGFSSYKDENSCSFDKATPLTLYMQQSAYPPFGRGFLHSALPKGQSASDVNCLHGVSSVANHTGSFNAMKSPQLVERQWPELRSCSPSQLQQESRCNGKMIPKEQESIVKHGSKTESQPSNALFNSYVSQSESEAASRQSQPQSSSSSDQHRLSKHQLPRGEEEELVIQGGIINVSSVYSQGLLDTLTQALQNSGLDLSQANISVQIDLGRRSRASEGTVNAKGPGQTIVEPLTSQQSQSQPRSGEATVENEQPNKRPKIENDP